MKKLNTFLLVIFLGSLVCLLWSCESCVSGKRKGNGPPPHAKAWGYRGKQQPRTQVEIGIQAAPGFGSSSEVPPPQINTTVVNIVNSNGSITPVTLRRSGNVWIGPKGGTISFNSNA